MKVFTKIMDTEQEDCCAKCSLTYLFSKFNSCLIYFNIIE